ncbi:MAG: phosphate propanoyltransferase [Kofleriaceae bacterium]
MTRQPWSIQSGASLEQGRDRMGERGIRHLPVLAEHQVVGLLCDEDVRAVAAIQGNFKTIRVDDVMRLDVHVVAPTASVGEVVSKMATLHHDAVVVTNPVGEPEGIFTAIDGLHAFGDILRRFPTVFALPPIPIGVSSRHVHLSRGDCDSLFGKGYELAPRHEVTQPHQYVMSETVTLVGPLGEIEHVGIVNPLRTQTQVELSRTDAHRLGIDPPVRESGHLANTPGLRIRGPHGEIEIPRGAIVARRHVHMSPADASLYGVSDHDLIRVRIDGERAVVLDDVVVRVAPDFRLDLHLDTDEANACNVTNLDVATFVGFTT